MTDFNKRAIEFVEFVRDACVRLNAAQAVQNHDTEMLTEELDDIEEIACDFLEAFVTKV